MRSAFLPPLLMLLCLSASWAQSPSPKPVPSASTAARAPVSVRDRDWLSANSSSPDFAPALLEAARVNKDPAQSILLLADYYGFLKKPQDRFDAAAMLGSLFEIRGSWDLAADWYGKALGSVEDRDIRLRRAIALAKVGSFDEALKCLASLPRDSREYRGPGALIGAWCLAASGKLEQGLESSLAIAAEADLKEWHPRALWLAAILDGSLEEGGGARDRLVSLWPGSPEAMAASSWSSSGRVSARRDPLLLLSGIMAGGSGALDLPTSSVPSPAASALPPKASPGASPSRKPAASPAATGPARDADLPFAYQIGVYSRKENAQRQMEALKAQGFDARTKEGKGGDGSARWTVFVPVGKDPQSVFIRLHEAGYDVYPLYE